MLSASLPWLVFQAPVSFTATQTHMDNCTNYIDHHLAGRAGFSQLPLHIVDMVGWHHIWVTSDVTVMMMTGTANMDRCIQVTVMMSQMLSPSHPGSMTDSTVIMVDLAAGQDMWHRLCRPPVGPSHAKYALWEESNLTALKYYSIPNHWTNLPVWSSTSSHGSNAFNKKDNMLAKIIVYKKQSLKP